MLADNQKIAILTKFNEVAERFGVKSYDIEASVKYDKSNKKAVLQIEEGWPEHAAAKINTLLDAIAGKNGMENGDLSGSPKEIIEALDQALALAPRHISR